MRLAMTGKTDAFGKGTATGTAKWRKKMEVDLWRVHSFGDGLNGSHPMPPLVRQVEVAHLAWADPSLQVEDR
jgi:hypothetical protein